MIAYDVRHLNVRDRNRRETILKEKEREKERKREVIAPNKILEILDSSEDQCYVFYKTARDAFYYIYGNWAKKWIRF